MPDRIIRDELLRSHRYVTLPSDTHRILFVHLMLDADDFGNAEATTTSLGFLMARHISEEVAASLLGALGDADLLRIYLIDGKRYVHIPRFRQRLRITKEKHPRPPENIDDFKNNKLKPDVRHSQADVSHVAVEVKRSEEKRRDKTLAPARTRSNSDANKPNPEPETPVDKIGATIQHLTARPPKTDQDIEAERARQLAYVWEKTKGKQ